MTVVLNSLSGEAMELTVGLLAPFGRFVELSKRKYLAGHAISACARTPNNLPPVAGGYDLTSSCSPVDKTGNCSRRSSSSSRKANSLLCRHHRAGRWSSAAMRLACVVRPCPAKSMSTPWAGQRMRRAGHSARPRQDASCRWLRRIRSGDGGLACRVRRASSRPCRAKRSGEPRGAGGARQSAARGVNVHAEALDVADAAMVEEIFEILATPCRRL